MPTLSPRKLLFAATLASAGAALANPAATPLTTASGRPACGNTNTKRQCARTTEPATLSAEVAAPLRTPADRPDPVALATPVTAPTTAAVGRRSPFFAGLRSLLRVTISPAVALTPLLTAEARPACSNLVGKGDMTSSESTVLPCPQAAP